MTKEELYAHPGWEWCTFEGARRQVLLAGLRMTFREKLEWLEQAEALALRLRASSTRLRDHGTTEEQDHGTTGPQDNGTAKP